MVTQPRKIFCHYLKREVEGLEYPPYPGKLGQQLYDHISCIAWQEWQHLQTRLINEKRLNMLNPAHRQLLEQEMVKFLFAGENCEVAGYIPPRP